MTITHTYVTTIPDGGDATLVEPSDWNAAHTIASGTITVAQLSATGSPSSSTFLRGDGTWSTTGAASVPPAVSAAALINAYGSFR